VVINNRHSYRTATLLIFFSALFFSSVSFSQEAAKDSSRKDLTNVHSPKVASICSAIIPGLGQVYNKKIWKVPIIYVGLGTLLYYLDRNNTRYRDYKELIGIDTLIIEGKTITGSELDGYKTKFRVYRDSYRRSRDLDIIGIAAIYILNIIDANVDANLYDYDVSDKLSFHWEPAYMKLDNKSVSLGLRCCIKF
jgi:hypothetical protein